MSSCSSIVVHILAPIFQVTRVSLGGAGFGAAEEGQIYGGVSDDEAVACVHQAIERGNLFFGSDLPAFDSGWEHCEAMSLQSSIRRVPPAPISVCVCVPLFCSFCFWSGGADV